MSELKKTDYAREFARSWFKIMGMIAGFFALVLGGGVGLLVVIMWPTLLGEYVVHGSVTAQEPLSREWHIFQWINIGLLFTFGLAWSQMDIEKEQ